MCHFLLGENSEGPAEILGGSFYIFEDPTIHFYRKYYIFIRDVS